MTEPIRSDDRATGEKNAGDGHATEGAASRGRRLDERLRAVERALTGSDTAVAEVADSAEATAERRAIGSRLSDLETRVEELEAATQALRGYTGAVRAVNSEVERRADLALARASRGRDRDGAHAAPGSDSESRDASPDEIPTASALEAAVPSESGGRVNGTRSSGDAERGDADGPTAPDGSETTDRSGTAGERDETDETSWSRDALDRLRGSV